MTATSSPWHRAISSMHFLANKQTNAVPQGHHKKMKGEERIFRRRYARKAKGERLTGSSRTAAIKNTFRVIIAQLKDSSSTLQDLTSWQSVNSLIRNPYCYSVYNPQLQMSLKNSVSIPKIVKKHFEMICRIFKGNLNINIKPLPYIVINCIMLVSTNLHT